MTEQQLPPGTARASGPTVADVLQQDTVAPPAPLFEESYEFLGDDDIDTRRYTSEEFARREAEKLWPRTWQWACREEHLQEVGDHYIYEVGSFSVIVVRSSQEGYQAFMNSCTHRGTKLFAAAGCGYSEAITCPFHGWSWHLNGSLRNIPGRWDFPHASEETHSLREISCERWGGFIFINMDKQAPPLASVLDVMPAHFAHFPLERRRIAVHVEKELPANWKAAQEAFLEAYHSFETHNSPHGANAQYDIFGTHVTRFIHNIATYSPTALDDYPGNKWRQPVLSEAEQLRDMGIEGELPDGATARSTAAAAMRQSMGEALGVDLSACSDSLMLDSIEYHLFPNMFFFPGISIPMVYRFRPYPGDVDRCLFDLVVLEPLAEGAPHPEPPEPVRLGIEQSYTEVEALKWLGPIYDEDTGNLDMQQKGFKTSGKAGITLGNYQESRIRRVHLTLDEYLGEQVLPPRASSDG